MRVLHVIPGLSPKDGGPTTALHRMAASTAARGIDVTVATTDDDAGGRLDVPLGTPVVSNGVRYLYFRRTLPGSWKFSYGLTRWLWSNVASFDVVHVHALFSYATIPGCRLSFRAGVPVVLRPLGTASPWSLRHRGWKKRPYFPLIERKHLRKAAAIHTTSDAERDGIAALGLEARAVVIPMGIDVSDDASPERPDTDRLRILFLSRLHPVKNIPLLLQSVGELRDSGVALSLTIAGAGTAEYLASLEAQVTELKIGHLVEFVGQVGGSEKAALLARHDVYVLPSFHENFGIAAAEAMAAGLPAVVSDQVGIAKDIKSGGAGLVVPLEGSALTSALRSLAADRELRSAMGARAIAVARRYSWSEVARELETLYRRVTNPPEGNP